LCLNANQKKMYKIHISLFNLLLLLLVLIMLQSCNKESDSKKVISFTNFPKEFNVEAIKPKVIIKSLIIFGI
jgi:hypothetical protein